MSLHTQKKATFAPPWLALHCGHLSLYDGKPHSHNYRVKLFVSFCVWVMCYKLHVAHIYYFSKKRPFLCLYGPLHTGVMAQFKPGFWCVFTYEHISDGVFTWCLTTAVTQAVNPRLWLDCICSPHDRSQSLFFVSLWCPTTSAVLFSQGRQKLARFNAREFATLIIDILSDAKRRQQGKGLSSPAGKTGIIDRALLILLLNYKAYIISVVKDSIIICLFVVLSLRHFRHKHVFQWTRCISSSMWVCNVILGILTCQIHWIWALMMTSMTMTA